MSNLSAAEHLKVARRLHFQGQNEAAIREYQLVLEIEPENEDAASGLRNLGIEPPDPARRFQDAGSSVKTNFFVNQAKSSELPAWRTGPFKVVIAVLACLMGYAIYTAVIMFLNFDNIKAAENVDGHITKVRTKEEGDTFVDVQVYNYNPGPVKDVVISYVLGDGKGGTVKEGKIPIKTMIPPGDHRTFVDIDLGMLNGKPDKVERNKVESVVYGPKPKINQRLAERFIDAAQKDDVDAFHDYDDLSQELESFPPVLIGLGRSYAALAGKTPSNWDHAIEQYKKAIDCEPDNANAHYYLAVAYFYKKDLAKAKKEIDTAAELAPDDPLYDFSQRYLFHTKEAKDAKTAQDKAKSAKKGSKASKAAANHDPAED